MDDPKLPPEQLGPVADFEHPPGTPPPAHINGWCPDLNPTQQLIFDDLALYIIAYGEKGSGKSIGCYHALVRHCYEEDNALALLIAPQIRTGKIGALYDLEYVLDVWRNGNWADREQTVRSDAGMGLEYTSASLDPQTKDRCIWIGNRHGGWSQVILMSIPYAEVVEKRMKDLAPSFVLLSEITELENKKFFTFISQQLGRRRGIKGPQQYVCNCNPEGPSHWVYEVFWIDCVDQETGIRDKNYSVYHVKIHENRHNLPPGYIERLEALYKDPLDRQRLLDGQWVDRPTGEAIFRQYFRKEIHVRGDASKNIGLTPKKGFPVFIGYDPGPANFSVHFEQAIQTPNKTIWIIFDELNFVGQYMPDFQVVPRVMERMAHWNKILGGARFVHIGDEASFTHRRPDGTYDATRLLELSKKWLAAHTEHAALGPIRMRPCPKGKESVPARVQMLINLFMDEALYVSAMCPKTVEMFRLIASDKPKEGKEMKYDQNVGLIPKRSAYIHPLDSASFPPFYVTMNSSQFALQTAPVDSGVFRAGGGR